MSELVKITHHGRVAVITLDRPAALNALSRELLVELDAALGTLTSTPDTAVLVITGAGEKAFAAGADIKEMSALDRRAATDHSRFGQAVCDRVAALDRPVIAAVNGFALGGGCELAMACHVRYASTRARFGQPEVKLGLIPGFGGTQRLARLVGRGRALELLLDGSKVLDAETAMMWGLVNAVFPPEELLPQAIALGERIAAMAPLPVGWIISAVSHGLERGLTAGLRQEAELFGRCFETADGQEGMRAFLERRAARFTGE